MNRRRLPDRRFSETFSVDCDGLSYRATVSYFSDGQSAKSSSPTTNLDRRPIRRPAMLR